MPCISCHKSLAHCDPLTMETIPFSAPCIILTTDTETPMVMNTIFPQPFPSLLPDRAVEFGGVITNKIWKNP